MKYNEPKFLMLSIQMITYNHARFIHQAIEGVLMQETNFEYDLIITDDCSPDNTQEIVEGYVKNHPKGYRIKYFRHEKNIGMQANGIFAFDQCQGKYIAICEGDDYWTDPLKLQKQVDFLETNPDYTFSMGRVDMLQEKTGKIIKNFQSVNPEKKGTYTLRDYIKSPFSQTSSFVFRNSKNPLPSWFNKVHAGDQSLVVIKTGLNGKIKYHKDLFSVYRLNDQSITYTSDLKILRVKADFFLNKINEFTEYKFNKIIKLRLVITKYYYNSRSNNFLIKFPAFLIYRILLILVKKI